MFIINELTGFKKIELKQKRGNEKLCRQTATLLLLQKHNHLKDKELLQYPNGDTLTA